MFDVETLVLKKKNSNVVFFKMLKFWIFLKKNFFYFEIIKILKFWAFFEKKFFFEIKKH